MAVSVTDCPAVAGEGLAVIEVVVAVSADAAPGAANATVNRPSETTRAGKRKRRDDMPEFS